MTTRRLLITFTGMAVAFSALGQLKSMRDVAMDSTLTSHKLIYFGKGEEPPRDSVSNLIRQFYENQFHHFSDPLAPYFLFLSKDSKLAMGMGGCVRMRAYYDWGGSIPSPGFAPYLIPMTKDPTRSRYFGTTPSGTTRYTSKPTSTATRPATSV